MDPSMWFLPQNGADDTGLRRRCWSWLVSRFHRRLEGRSSWTSRTSPGRTVMSSPDAVSAMAVSSAGCGDTSTNARTPRLRTSFTASVKNTGCLKFLIQCEMPSLGWLPLTVLISGISPGRTSKVSTASRKGSSTSSISGQCEAKSTSR